MVDEKLIEQSPSANVFLVNRRANDLWAALISSGRTLSVEDRFSVIDTVERLQRVLEIDWQRKSKDAA